MEKVGFVGVGHMGTGMAKNLLKEGYQLTAYDVNTERLQALAKQGAGIAESAREVGEDNNTVFVMVFDGPQVEQVIGGEEGLLESMSPESTIICTSTILPSEMKEIGEMVSKKGVNLVDSPVSGGAPGAARGTLCMMAATKKKVFEDVLEFLQVVGQDVYHVGEEIGMGQITKAAHQAYVGICAAGMAEALVFGTKAGLDPQILSKVIGSGYCGNFLFNSWSKDIMERNFCGGGSPIYTLPKDLSIALQTGKDYGVPLFGTSLAYEMYKVAMKIAPKEDCWAIIKPLERMVGVEVRKKNCD